MSGKHSRALFLVLAAVCALVVRPSAAVDDPPKVTASAETVKVVSQTETSADVELRITVTNGESLPVSNVRVVFADETEVAVADVEPDGSTVSETQSRTLDISELPTRHFPVPVKLKFVLDGGDVELAQTLVVTLAAHGGQQ